MFYKSYQKLFKQKEITTGFSPRLPDFAVKYWLDQLEKAAQSSKHNKFLDIGAGLGRLTTLLANSDFEKGCAIEVDVDHDRWLKILKKYPKISLVEGFLQENIKKIKTNENFDFVLLAEVFEHIPPKDVNCFLSSLHEVLDSNGKVFLTTPNRVVVGPAEGVTQWHERQPYGHHKHYTYNELKELLEMHGFQIEWHTFEGHRIKKKFYNKFFYPVARLDQKLLMTKKLPTRARSFYKLISAPFIWCVRGFFWFFSQLINLIEVKFNNENNAETIILLISKR